MQLIPVSIPLISAGDDLTTIIGEHAEIEDGDIVVVSSKIVATSENAFIDLTHENISPEAIDLHRSIGRSAAFCQAVLEECDRLRGSIIHTCPGAALTEVRPHGLAHGSILIANAGLDESNCPPAKAIGWPREPVRSIRSLKQELTKKNFKNHIPHSKFAILITDSCCMPRRKGVTAIALVASGIDPLLPQEGLPDLFGKPLRITTEAVADQLAAAANFLMGNAAKSTPVVLVRDHGLAMSEFEGWVPGIEKDEDLFGPL